MGREGAARAQGAGEGPGCGGMRVEPLYPTVMVGILHILWASSLGCPYHRSVPPSSLSHCPTIEILSKMGFRT